MNEPATRFRVGPRDAGKRLDRFLGERIPGLSRTRIQSAIRERVELSWGVAARPATPVRPGGEVAIGFRDLNEVLLDLKIPVIVREPGWMAVDKPAGIPVHPVNRILENSLIRMLRRQENDTELRLVHRLDRETSGVLLVARDGATAGSLAKGFVDGSVRKQYLAMVRGRVESLCGRIDGPVGAAPDSKVFTRRAVVDDGQPALTEWQVEKRFPNRTLLRLFPRSGRRHQIRVHLEAIGHPIVGDILYGRPDRDYLDLVDGVRDPRQEEGGPARHLLHAAAIDVRDPKDGRERRISAPVPGEFGYNRSSK